ncbi:MAG: restriction endonuclease [Anaerolineae bacterium CG17_big_fil_post_rev_8_21_14_2_50_57_27]|nr:MAG: restriction endonuclease [Anaerolineae bacterium CG17_big_fil_post_rev_8_21_14_2_50_57_27]
MEHEFTAQILEVLKKAFGDRGDFVFEKSPLLQYLNIKTRSASKGSKSRGSFANLYAIYVLVEDYLKHGFDGKKGYNKYEGARFTALLDRQRELPFGSKLQNHALNHRLNEEFRKYFPEIEYIPILRDIRENRYWFNENLLKIKVGTRTHNIAQATIEIIDHYVQAKVIAFQSFIETCERLKAISDENDLAVSQFIEGLLAPNADARIFEIVSYAILRFYYHDQIVYFGFDLAHIKSENLQLFKTGRTNANDGGIDFVMRPLGRFFQVTETLDVKKYFLDIDKIDRFPISFVVKSMDDGDTIRQRLHEGAQRLYSINAIVEKYMACIEEIINIPVLINCFRTSWAQGYLRQILDEIILQSKVEFNYENVG